MRGVLLPLCIMVPRLVVDQLRLRPLGLHARVLTVRLFGLLVDIPGLVLSHLVVTTHGLHRCRVLNCVDVLLLPRKDVVHLDLRLVVPAFLDFSLVHQHEFFVVHVQLGSVLILQVLEEDCISQLHSRELGISRARYALVLRRACLLIDFVETV